MALARFSSGGPASPGQDPAARLGHEALPAPWNWNRALSAGTVLKILPVAGLLVWAYWHPLTRWRAIWDASDAWSHGYFILPIAVLIAHYRLQERAPRRLAPWAPGLALVLLAAAVRIVSFTTKHGYPGEATFVLAVAGALLWLLGTDMFKTLWVSAAYLVLMVPWDQKYYENVALPLQRKAAQASELFLRLVGYQFVDPEVLKAWLAHPPEWGRWVARIDNVLYIPSMGQAGLTIAGPCSGLHLLFAFVALGVLMAFVDRRAWWERLVIVVSSVPIAVFCNFVRVTLMALSSDELYFARKAMLLGERTWLAALSLGPQQVEGVRNAVLDPESFTHQSFGYLMLGLAFLLMWLELKAINLLFITEEEGAPARASEPRVQQAAPLVTLAARNKKRRANPKPALERSEGSGIRNPEWWAWAAAGLLLALAALAGGMVARDARAAASARAEFQARGDGAGAAYRTSLETPAKPPEDVVLARRAGALMKQAVLDGVAVLAALVGAAAVGAGLLRGRGEAWPWAAAVVPVAYLAMYATPLALRREPLDVVTFLVAAGAAAVYGRILWGVRDRFQYGACLGALGTVAVFFQFWEPPPPKPLPIRQSLERQFPRELGTWRGEFVRLDETTEKYLAADDYLNLRLRDGATGRAAMVFVTYSANAMSNVPHVPWVCMTQAGFLLKRSDQRDVILRPLGNKEVSVNVLYFEPKEGVEGPPALMLQYFNVGHRYTTSREAARWLATMGSLRGSYLSQTQVAVWLEEGEKGDPFAKDGPVYGTALALLEQVAVILEREFYPDLEGQSEPQAKQAAPFKEEAKPSWRGN